MNTIALLTSDQDGVIAAAIEAEVGPSARIVRPEARTVDAVRALLPSADVVIGDWSSAMPLGVEESRLGGSVRLVQQPGVGVNFIDVDAWTKAGVPVCNTPGANTDSVAEWAVTASSYLNRSVGWADAEVRAGRWPQEEILQRGCRDLGECRVGIVGFGHIGRRAAGLFAAYGCEVSYTSRTERPDAEFTFLGLDDLVSRSDILVLAVALDDDTRGLIGSAQFAHMPAGAILVNVARGGVVDESAMIAALAEGQIAGAALDVVSTEPLPAGSPLRGFDNVLLSPHVAGGTSTALHRVSAMVAQNTARALAGHEPLWRVTL